MSFSGKDLRPHGSLSAGEYTACVLLALIVVAIVWVLPAHFESETFNRLTGANTTTWDAMWTELRVQEGTAKDATP